jgi:hypothetical protein
MFAVGFGWFASWGGAFLSNLMQDCSKTNTPSWLFHVKLLLQMQSQILAINIG